MRDQAQIRAVLPHRYPFLFIDRVLEVSADGKRAVAIKNVTANEPFFQGHFPDNPIMPGVLIVEALAQASSALLSPDQFEGKLAVLAGLNDFKFRRPVRPGDVLRLEVSMTRFRFPLGRVAARATVDGEVAAEGEISFVLTNPAELQ